MEGGSGKSQCSWALQNNWMKFETGRNYDNREDTEVINEVAIVADDGGASKRIYL